MAMNADERRAELEVLGYAVAPMPYLAGVWYMLRLHPDGTRGTQKREDLDGRQYSVELESGRWVRWGEGAWREWEALFAPPVETGECAELPAGCFSGGDFLEQCRAAGFALLGDVNHVGNVWATREDGSRWLLLTWSERILGDGLQERALHAFIGLPETDKRTPPRPFVERVEVQTSGRNVQRGLFAGEAP